MPDAPHEGFTPSNTVGLDRRELAALNRALARLIAAGLGERDAKLALDAAVRDWLLPRDAGEADLERLLVGKWV